MDNSKATETAPQNPKDAAMLAALRECISCCCAHARNADDVLALASLVTAYTGAVESIGAV